MEGSTADEWGNQFADIYDELPAYRGDAALRLEVLASLAANGSALELGVGTGIVALPLAQKGCHVSVIDGSERMLDRLRAKPGAERLSIVCGDFAAIPVDGPFELIYVVGGAFTCLVSQEDQVRCFRSVSRKLSPHGAFVVEEFVPWELNSRDSWLHHVTGVSGNFVNFTVGRVDVVRQVLDTQLVNITNHGTKLYPAKYRYVWPSELDLMAEIAGLKLEERWGTWDKRPFTADSMSQISVFRPK